MVYAKKYLGQHFLKSEPIADDIASSLSVDGYRHVIEIGPGRGMLTKYLIRRPITLLAITARGAWLGEAIVSAGTATVAGVVL